MLLGELRAQVLEANLELVRRGLVLYTFGNASGIDREQGLVVIKPSGVDYEKLRPEHMVVTDLQGKVVEGELRPSSDLDTHTLLYNEFPGIGAVVHTHSEFATSFAQAGLPIPPLGTTHADYFYGPVPVTNPLPDHAIAGDYVRETGLAIVARLAGDRDTPALDPLAVPACARPLTTQWCGRRGRAWPTAPCRSRRTRRRCRRRCWTGTTFASMAPRRPMGRAVRLRCSAIRESHGRSDTKLNDPVEDAFGHLPL